MKKLWAVLFVGVFFWTGCGYLLVNGPPEQYKQLDYVSCTESNAGPIIDAVWGGLNLAGAIGVAADPDAYTNSGSIIASGLVWTGISGSAAIVGMNKTKRCREAKRFIATKDTGSSS